jgi:hypothetical protein
MMLSWLAGLTLMVIAGPLAGTALAADAKQIADALVAAINADGESTVTYESATASGDDVTITNLKIDQADDSQALFPTVVISGAAAREPGGFSASRITLDNGSAKADTETFKWATASVDGAVVPSPDEIKAKKGIIPFTRLSIAGINVTGEDMAAPVEIASITAEIGGVADGQVRDFKTTVSEIKVPAVLFTEGDEETKAVFEQLGYNEFLIDVEVDGGFDSAIDALTLRTVSFDTTDVGKLGISGKFGGVSMKTLADDDTAAANAKLENLTIRFDNSGIVERSLDMQAKMMGGTREEVADQLSGALPLLLNALENPTFQEKVAVAASAFLKDPKSLTLTATPASPVPFAEIMEAVGNAPSTLPDLLKFEITANN